MAKSMYFYLHNGSNPLLNPNQVNMRLSYCRVRMYPFHSGQYILPSQRNAQTQVTPKCKSICMGELDAILTLLADCVVASCSLHWTSEVDGLEQPAATHLFTIMEQKKDSCDLTCDHAHIRPQQEVFRLHAILGKL